MSGKGKSKKANDPQSRLLVLANRFLTEVTKEHEIYQRGARKTFYRLDIGDRSFDFSPMLDSEVRSGKGETASEFFTLRFDMTGESFTIELDRDSLSWKPSERK